jgi:hypothetical protein
MYFMLTAKEPDDSIKNLKALNNSVKEDVSSDCFDFMIGCLRSETFRRLSFEEVLVHKFVSQDVHNILNLATGKRILREVKDVNTKFLMNMTYKCCRGIRNDVVLDCEHSFCMGVLPRSDLSIALRKDMMRSLLRS